MKRPFRRIALASAAFLAILGASESFARQAPEASRPALWKVADEDTTIYLFGTVHALPDGIYWYIGKVADSFNQSQELVTEILESGDAGQSAVLATAVLPPDKTLRGLMSEAERAAFERALAGMNLQPGALDRFKPWYAAIYLATRPILDQGFNPANSVETTLAAQAKAMARPHTALETAEYQLGLFDSLPQEVQLRYLAEVVRTMPEAKNEIAGMVEAWKKGDAEELARIMNKDENEPALMEKLLYARNRTWAHWIRARLDRPGTVFVAVGAGHLAGEGSVQDDLGKMGIASTRIQ